MTKVRPALNQNTTVTHSTCPQFSLKSCFFADNFNAILPDIEARLIK